MQNLYVLNNFLVSLVLHKISLTTLHFPTCKISMSSTISCEFSITQNLINVAFSHMRNLYVLNNFPVSNTKSITQNTITQILLHKISLTIKIFLGNLYVLNNFPVSNTKYKISLTITIFPVSLILHKISLTI